jgi:hypothetical protein
VLLPEGEEYVTCGGTYAGPQLSNDLGGGVFLGMSRGTCIGCPMVFVDHDEEDEPASFQCSQYAHDGSCVDLYDSEPTGFVITKAGDICATTDIDAVFTATLKSRRRRLRERGRNLAVDDVTVCYNVTASDTGARQYGEQLESNKTIVCVTIKDTNYAPTMSNQTFIVPENVEPGSHVGVPMDGHDIDTVNDIADTLTYSIVRNVSGTTPAWAADVFAIDSQTGSITAVENSYVDDDSDGRLVSKDDASQGLIPSSTLNFEQQQIFTLTVTVVDDGGCHGRYMRDSSVECAKPLSNGLPRCDDCCSEADRGDFARSCCSWNSTTDGRRPTSMCDPNLSQTRTITIIVMDQNEPPRIDKNTFAIEENSSPGTTVGKYNSDKSDCYRKHNDDGYSYCFEAPVTASDDDAGQTCTPQAMESDLCNRTKHLTFRITERSEHFKNIHSQNLFTIHELNGQISITPDGSEMINYEEKDQWRLEIEVSDSGLMSSGSQHKKLSHRRNVTVFVVDVNEPPSMNMQTFFVSESSRLGSIVGQIKSHDIDRVYSDDMKHLQIRHLWDAASPVYSILNEGYGNVGSAFEISPNGTLTVASDILDYEDIRQYDIVVRIVDDGGFNKNELSVTQTIRIFVNDTNDALIHGFGVGTNVLGQVPLDVISGEVVMETRGGQKIDIFGSNFGSKHGGLYSVYATYGVTGTEKNAIGCIIKANYSTISCTTVAGVGKNLRWIVRIVDLVGTTWQQPLTSISPLSSIKTRYHAPKILKMENHVGMSTEGGELVLLKGTNFGPVGTPISASYGSFKSFPGQAYIPSCEITKASVLDSNVTEGEIECVTVPGVGRNLYWEVIVTEQSSSLFKGSAYALPVVHSVWVNSSRGQFFQTDGGESFTIDGKNFGGIETMQYFDPSMADIKLRVFYGHRERLSKVKRESVLLWSGVNSHCSTTQGALSMGTRVCIRHGVGEDYLKGEISQSYDSSYDILLDHVRLYEATGCSALSHTQIQCISVPGRGHQYFVQVVVVEQEGPASTTTIRYAPPTIDTINGPGARDASTAGRQLIQIAGENFGPEGPLSGFMSYGHPEYVQSDNDLCGQCSKHGTCANETHMNVSSCGPSGCTCHCDLGFSGRNCETCADVDNYICDKSVHELFEVTGTQNGFDMRALDCRVTTGHKQIRCLTSQGTGKDHYFVVNVEGQTSIPVFGNNSYAVPVIETYSGEGVKNARTSGGQVVILQGREFGSIKRNKVQWVKYGKINSDVQFAAQNCRVLTDHTKILCQTAPGVGKDLQWRVNIDGQESILSTTNYGVPKLFEVLGLTTMRVQDDTYDPSNVYAATDGGTSVSLKGMNFGPPNRADEIFVSVTYGPTGAEYVCEDSRVVSHELVECKMVPGVGQKLHWKVYVHDQNSSVSKFWTAYKPPIIVRVERVLPETDDVKFPLNVDTGSSANEVSTAGGDIVRIWGTDFGVNAPVMQLNIIFDGMSYDLAWDDVGKRYIFGSHQTINSTLHFVDFLVPEGQGQDKIVQVEVQDTVRAKKRSNKAEIHYAHPKVLGVNIYEGKEKGYLTLFVRGKNFGKSSKLGSVRVSQNRGDFFPNKPPVMPVSRVGGARHMITTDCYRHYSLLKTVGSGYSIQQCTFQNDQECLAYNSVVHELEKEAIDGTPAKNTLVYAVANEEMCTVPRIGKSSCKWDKTACVPYWGEEMRSINETAGDWTHDGIEFQYFGDKIPDPDCIDDPCDLIVEGFVEVEVKEIPRNAEKPRSVPSQVSPVMYFASYSPQIWSVALLEDFISAFSVVGPKFDHENVTKTKFYEAICGDFGSYPAVRAVIEGYSLQNEFCGPCVGKRKCEFTKRSKLRGSGNSTGLCGITGNCYGMQKSDREKLFFTTAGGEEVTVYGRYMSEFKERLKVSVSPRGQPNFVKYGSMKRAELIDKKLKIYKIVFSLPAGSGLNNELQVDRGGQKSAPVYIHYKPPMIHAVCYSGRCFYEKDNDDRIFGLNLDTVGGVIEIRGEELGDWRNPNPLNGLRSYTSRLSEATCKWLGPQAIVDDYAGKKLERVRCEIQPGQGAQHDVKLEIGGQRSNSFMLNYNPPIILNITVGNAENNAVSTDPMMRQPMNRWVTIVGRNFGVKRRSDESKEMKTGHQKVKIGSHECRSLLFEEESVNVVARLRCLIPAGQGIKPLAVIVSNLQTATPFYFRKSHVSNVRLVSGNLTGRTDGLIYEGGPKDIIIIEGANLGEDGFIRVIEDNNTAIRFGDGLTVTSMNSTVLVHNHTHILMELPEAPGGRFPTKNLRVFVLQSGHINFVGSNGFVLDTGDNSLRGTSSAMFSYTKPIYISIRNLYVDERPEWKAIDSGDTDGWYAVLHGENFGEGCNGDCAGKLDASSNSTGISFESRNVQSKIGTIRWMAEKYEFVAPGEPPAVLNFWEEVNAYTKSVDCSCFALKGMKSKECGEVERSQCEPIKWWNHTHIIFYVRQGTGHSLPLQVETGGQRDCEVNINRRDGMRRWVDQATPFTEASMKWCKPLQGTFKCDHPPGLGAECPDNDAECTDQKDWCRKSTPDQRCFCSSQHPNIAIHYDLPVIDKITPDVIAGHEEVSDVVTKQKNDLAISEARQALELDPFNETAKAILANATENAKDLYPPPLIGSPGEEIKISGTGFGSQVSFPNVTIDGFECTKAKLIMDESILEPYITCIAPILLVGPKGYNTKTRRSKLSVLVGGQYAIINPEMKASTKLNLLQTQCKRTFYGQNGEKCLKCPRPATETKPEPGTECPGGAGAEPIATYGWYKVNLAKDRRISASSNRSMIGPYTEDNSFIPWTKICISGNTTESKRVEWILDGNKCFMFEDTKLMPDGSGKGTSVFVTPSLPKSCSNQKGKPVKCCLQHMCDDVKGWVGVFDTEGNEDRSSRDALAQGCLLPHDAYGDPRYYTYLEDGYKGKGKPGCYSHTYGWWIWEEDYSWHFGRPQRVKEQEVNLDRGLENKCVKDRWHRDVCPYTLPCEPLEACVGDNKCGLGYAGKKCNKCDQGFFRKDGFCLTCPTNPGLVIAMLCVAMLGVGAVFYIIKKLKINIGVISIGIDYFQVLGLFNNPLIPWP